MIINGHGKYFFGMILLDDIVVQQGFDLSWRKQFLGTGGAFFFVFFGNDFTTKVDTFVTYVHRWSGDQFSDFLLGLPAK